MAYQWQVYKACQGEQLQGYIFARDPEEATAVWNRDVAALIGTEITEMEDAEFYATSPEEGGFVIFLAPDELVDFYIEPHRVGQPQVFYHR